VEATNATAARCADEYLRTCAGPRVRRCPFVDKHHFADGDFSDLVAAREVLLVHQ
jgi:hypothetical protein